MGKDGDFGHFGVNFDLFDRPRRERRAIARARLRTRLENLRCALAAHLIGIKFNVRRANRTPLYFNCCLAHASNHEKFLGFRPSKIKFSFCVIRPRP